jgi:thioredoxin 1
MDKELERIKKEKMEKFKQEYFERGTNMDRSSPNKPINISDADLDENIRKFSSLVVDCWAPWCGPCRMVGPIIEDLAQEFHGKIVFGKLNVDENQATSSKFGIMSIPTLLVFKNGNLVDRIVGALPKDLLKDKLAHLIE